MEKIVASRAEATVDRGRSSMELERARSLLTAERARLRQSLADVGAAQTQDRQA
jgi:hypothetical protein